MKLHILIKKFDWLNSPLDRLTLKGGEEILDMRNFRHKLSQEIIKWITSLSTLPAFYLLGSVNVYRFSGPPEEIKPIKSIASGDYVMLMDDDDLPYMRVIADLINRIHGASDYFAPMIIRGPTSNFLVCSDGSPLMVDAMNEIELYSKLGEDAECANRFLPGSWICNAAYWEEYRLYGCMYQLDKPETTICARSNNIAGRSCIQSEFSKTIMGSDMIEDQLKAMSVYKNSTLCVHDSIMITLMTKALMYAKEEKEKRNRPSVSIQGSI